MIQIDLSSARLNIVLHDNQRKIHDRKTRFKAIKAGKRFGKTKWAIFEICQKAGLYPRGVFWYIAPSYRQAKSIAWNDLKWILPRNFVKRYLETELTVELTNDARIELKGADNEESLRGPSLRGVVFDEAAFSRPTLWSEVIRSQLIDLKGFAYFISTPKGRNWFTVLYEDFKRRELEGDADYSSHYYTIFDNPTLSREEIEKVRESCSDSTWNEEYMALEQDYTGQKYVEFDRKRNIGESSEIGSYLRFRGVDWGMNHPTVCLWAKMNERDKKVYIYDEYVKSGMTIRENVKNIIERSGLNPIEWSVIDPSANRADPISGMTLKGEFSRWGLHCIDGDRRERGTDIVKMFLKRGQVIISPKCRNLINELTTLEWDDKVGDDCTDALRYLLVKIHDVYGDRNDLSFHESISPESDLLNFTNKVAFPNQFRETNQPLEWILEEVA